MKKIPFESLDCIKGTTDIFVERRMVEPFLDEKVLLIEDKKGCQWLFYRAFAEPSGPRSWNDYLHFRLAYAPSEILLQLLTSPSPYEREFGRLIAESRPVYGY